MQLTWDAFSGSSSPKLSASPTLVTPAASVIVSRTPDPRSFTAAVPCAAIHTGDHLGGPLPSSAPLAAVTRTWSIATGTRNTTNAVKTLPSLPLKNALAARNTTKIPTIKIRPLERILPPMLANSLLASSPKALTTSIPIAKSSRKPVTCHPRSAIVNANAPIPPRNVVLVSAAAPPISSAPRSRLETKVKELSQRFMGR